MHLCLDVDIYLSLMQQMTFIKHIDGKGEFKYEKCWPFHSIFFNLIYLTVFFHLTFINVTPRVDMDVSLMQQTTFIKHIVEKGEFKFVLFILFFSIIYFNPLTRFLTPLQQTIVENIVAKGEIAHDEQFPPFTTMFSTLFKKCSFIF